MKKVAKPKDGAEVVVEHLNQQASEASETHEIEVAKPQSIRPADNSVEGFISQAIQQQLPVETIERFLAMRKELKADQAREAYVRAMAKLQGELPTIKKLKANDGTGSKYAPLEDIISQTRKVISENNFSYNWDTKTTATSIEVVCKATHADGHVETSTMVSDVAEGTKVNTAPQKAAITITYLKRYTLCNLFGIVVADEDMDARNEKSNPKQKSPLDPKAKIIHNLKTLGYETTDREVIIDTVTKLTQLELEEKNYSEIVSRLEILVAERNENN